MDSDLFHSDLWTLASSVAHILNLGLGLVCTDLIILYTVSFHLKVERKKLIHFDSEH